MTDSSTAPSDRPAGTHEFESFAEARRETRRNFFLHACEGGLYMGATTLLSAESVAPAMVASLGGSDLLVAFMPMLMMMGLSWPSLIFAHWIERLPRVMPLVLWTGALQRLPYLIAGLALLLGANAYPRTVLFIVVLTPFLSGTFCGISFPAWIELVSKTVSKKRRSPLWAVRNVTGGIIGLAAGGVIAYILGRFPGTTGFGILHLLLFVMLVLSYIIFLNIREPFHEHRLRAPPRNLKDNLRGIPALLKTDAALRNFTLMRICATGLFIMLPFLALHALETTGRPHAFLGQLVGGQMAGAILGNLAAGYLGNRHGGRRPAIIGRLFIAATCILSITSSNETGFLLAFFCLGIGNGMVGVGAMSLSIDICPPERRPTYIAFLTTLLMPSTLIMAGISAALKYTTGSFQIAGAVAAAFIVASTVFNILIKEPSREDVG